jgi:hypothetical protein
MIFMNNSDIERAVMRYGTIGSRPNPVLSRAARLLAAVADDADHYSDGWHSWPVPVRACAKLINLIQSGNATEAEYRKAVAPVKAFYTRAHTGKYGGSFPTFPTGF